MQGKLHVELLAKDFPGETPEGAAILVQKIRAADKTVRERRQRAGQGTGAGAWVRRAPLRIEVSKITTNKSEARFRICL